MNTANNTLGMESEKKDKKRGVSYFYRTATTSYLCYVPVLEESEGAGRRRLTPAAKVVIYSNCESVMWKVSGNFNDKSCEQNRANSI